MTQSSHSDKKKIIGKFIPLVRYWVTNQTQVIDIKDLKAICKVVSRSKKIA